MTVDDRYGDVFIEHRSESRQKPLPGVILAAIACIVVPLGIAFGFGRHDEIQVVATVIGIACLVLGLAYPFWGLIIFVGLLYTRPEDTIVALRGMHFTLVAAMVTVVSVVVKMLMDREKPVKTPINPLIIGFGIVTVISTLGAGNTVSAIMDVGKLVALVLIIINLVRTPTRYHILVTAIMLFTLYLSSYSLYLFFTGAALKRGDIMQAQGSGIFGDPNDLSATIVAGLGLALASIVRSKGPMKLVYGAAALFMMGGVYLTNSRGGMLAMVGVLAGFALLFSRAKWLAIVLTLVIAVGAVKYGPSRMSQLDTSEESANSRFRFWANGIDHFVRSPLIGVGYDRFTEINNDRTAHNSFVLCFTELGLLGYFCWAGCAYYCFQKIKPFQAGSTKPAAPAIEQQAATKPKRTANMAQRGIRVKPILPAADPRKDLRKDPAYCDQIGARLALGGFLMAAFWISRTYVPVLYILLALPISQQIAAVGAGSDFSETSQERVKNWTMILLLCIGSIVFIWLLSNRLKQ